MTNFEIDRELAEALGRGGYFHNGDGTKRFIMEGGFSPTTNDGQCGKLLEYISDLHHEDTEWIAYGRDFDRSEGAGETWRIAVCNVVIASLKETK